MVESQSLRTWVYMIEAEPLPSDSPRELRSGPGADLRFNISAVLGNNDGKFDWGRSAFEKTAGKITLQKNSAGVRCLLKAELLDIRGHYQEDTIDLHDKLELAPYTHQDKTYYRLIEKTRRPSGVCSRSGLRFIPLTHKSFT